MRWMRGLLLALLLAIPAVAQAQVPDAAAGAAQQTLGETGKELKRAKRGDVLADAPDTDAQIEQLRNALARLPIAAGLATLLAMRPRRRGTPVRKTAVIHTQIILAIVGAVVMLVVGSSLARAFGIVGAAGLVRYRAKIEDPKDAGVMLSTLAIGLASGVGLWLLASFTTVFILVVLWMVESFEPRASQLFSLTVKAKDLATLKPLLDKLLARRRLEYELRSSTPDAISYDVHYPIDQKTDRLSDEILKLAEGAAVQWEEKKEKK